MEKDILILGAGPGGMSASMHLSKAGIHHTIIDQATFPRDKICGDAISGKVTSLLHRLDANYDGYFNQQQTHFEPCEGISFISPNGQRLNLPFNQPKDKKYAGYISKRTAFDAFLFNQLDPAFASFRQEKVKDIKLREAGVEVTTDQSQYQPLLVLDATGAHSKLAQKAWGHKLEPKHHSAGIRAYYEHVNIPHQHFIELHFIDDVLPGYFWIFPLPNGEANVGLGMLTAEVSKNKVNLKETLNDLIQNHPTLKDRFKDAKLKGKIAGWGLPMGSKRRALSGNGYALIGDAASLIDPFTGEGIGNAMISGKIIADLISNHNGVPTTARDLSHYDEEVYRQLGSELKISHVLQKLLKFPRLFNVIAKKANRSEELTQLLINMFEDVDLREQLKKPSFYRKILFS